MLNSKYRRDGPTAVSGVVYGPLCDRVLAEWRRLCRGLGPNVAGNASSEEIYFLLYVRSLFPLYMTNYECVSAAII